VTRVRAGRRRFDFRRGLGFFLFTTILRSSPQPTQPPIQWELGALSLGVKLPVREVDLSPPSSAWSYPPLLQYVFMVWCLLSNGYSFMAWFLVKHMDKFTFYQIKAAEVGGACSTHEEDSKCIQRTSWKIETDTGVARKVILKWILKELGVDWRIRA
jgi:hypothetical protein